MKALSQFSFVFVIVMLFGCGGPLIVVHRTPAASMPPTVTEELPGIPFYVKTAGCKHQTVWLQPVYTLTLKRTLTLEKPTDKAQPEVEVHVVVLTLSQYRNNAVSALRALLSGSDQPTPEAVMNAWASVQALASGDPYIVDESQLSGTESGKVIRVVNQTAPEKYADYKTMYYYNTNKPLAGTAQASIKLGDDGTMTESSAQVESKTLQTFLSLLPVSDVLSKVASAYLPLIAEKAGAKTYKFELSTDTKIFKHAHEAFLKDAPNVAVFLKPPCPEELGDVKSPYNLTVEDVTEAKKEGADGKTVKVNGSIVLPKAEEKKK